MSDDQSVSNGAEHRHALYYPYIHIRDENWLKGALLGFQQVRRIVPERYTLKDDASIEPYAKLEGPAGPLLDATYVDASQIQETQNWLRGKINEHLPELQAKYSESETKRTLKDPDEFQMHAGKFIDPGFVEELTIRHHLAWYTRDPGNPDSMNWLTMHHKFGSAMMSVLALAVARLRGLSVVTPSERAHQALLANREEAVFEKLLEIPHPGGTAQDSGVTVEELSQVVITTGFDLTRLEPEDILELLKEGKDLRAFRSAVARFAGNIPKDVQSDERVLRLKQESEKVLEEWRKYTGALPKFAKDAIIDTALDKSPDKLIEAGLAGAAAGTAAGSILGAVPGLLITIAVAAGIKMFRKRDTPLRFLSKVDHIAEKRIGSIYVPLWRALAAQSA